MVVYSFSQINLYQQCPKKYQYRYLDKLEKAFSMTPDLLLGSSIHASLEWLYQELALFKSPTLEQLLAHFDGLWEKGKSEHQEQLRYKDEQDQEVYHHRGEIYLSQYFAKYYPFDQSKVVATELNLNFELKNSIAGGTKYQFRGIIDRLDKEGDAFVINDYKTNKQLPPAERDEYRDQLTLYAQALYQKYGHYLKAIKARLHYLHFDLVDEWTITPDILESVLKKYTDAIEKIEQARFDHNIGVEHAFPAQENNYCKYCEYQHLCPLWQHLNYGGDLVEGSILGTTTISKLVDRYAQLASQTAELNKEKDGLKMLLISYAQEKGFEQLFGEEYQLSLSQSTNYNAKDKHKLQNFLAEAGLLDEAIELPYYRLNKLVKSKQLSPSEIQHYLEGKTTWKLTTSKRKASKADEEI